MMPHGKEKIVLRFNYLILYCSCAMLGSMGVCYIYIYVMEVEETKRERRIWNLVQCSLLDYDELVRSPNKHANKQET